MVRETRGDVAFRDDGLVNEVFAQALAGSGAVFERLGQLVLGEQTRLQQDLAQLAAALRGFRFLDFQAVFHVAHACPEIGECRTWSRAYYS